MNCFKKKTTIVKKILHIITLLLLFTILNSAINSILLSQCNKAYADTTEKEIIYNGDVDDSTPSIEKDLFMGTFNKVVSDGELGLTKSQDDIEKRQELNFSIYKGEATGTYSLYDRFGGNVSFAMYLGEEPVKTGFIDKVYEYLISPQEEQEGFFKNLKSKVEKATDLLTKEPTYYTNSYYDTRPPLKQSDSDPRVTLYKQVGGVTAAENAILGMSNYLLSTTKTIVSATSFFISGEIVDAISTILTSLTTPDDSDSSLAQASNILKSLLKIILTLCCAGIVGFILLSTIRYVTGKQSLKQFIITFAGSLVSVGLAACLIASPSNFIDLTKTLMKFGENLIATSISLGDKVGDEVYKSDDTEHVLEASIWKTAVFEPWVEGTFGGLKYEQLYTTYSDKDDSNKWNLEADSAEAIGDISVPIGAEGNYVKNWAALALSCCSIYHIDSIEEERQKNIESLKKEAEKTDGVPGFGDKTSWPKASMPSSNGSIYVDDFRWIDAYLKVGHYADGANSKLDTTPYTGARKYEFNGLSAGAKSLWLGVLLIPLLILGIKKTASAFMTLGNFFILLIRSFMNVINPDNREYNLWSNVKATYRPLISYVFYLLLIFLCVELYNNLASSDNFITVLLYIFLSCYLMLLKPRKIVDHFNVASKFVVGKANETSAKLKDIGDSKARQEYASLIPKNTKEASYRINGKTQDAMEKERKQYEEKRKKLSEQMGGKSVTSGSQDAITADTYFQAISDPNNYKKMSSKVRDMYWKLRCDLVSAKLNSDVIKIIVKHRSDTDNINLDRNMLGIPVDAPISNVYDLRGGATREGFNQEEADRVSNERRLMAGGLSERNATKLNSIDRKRTILENEYGTDEYAKLTNKYKSSTGRSYSYEGGDVKLKKDYLKDLEKEEKQVIKDAKFDNAQSALNMLTGRRSGGSLIGLKWKLRIIAALIIIYLLGFIMSAII